MTFTRSLIFAALAIVQLTTEVRGMAVTEYTKVDTSIFNTGTLLDYRPRRLMMQARDNVVFSVKACSDVHIGLAVHLAEYVNVTEIVICGWSNMKSGIFDGFRGPLVTLIDTPNTCHCGEYRTFWVSWRFDKLEVGKGSTVGQQTFVSIPWTWQNQAELAFSTGAGHDGTWHVPENIGYHSIYYTYGKKNWYEEVWKTVNLRNHAIVFRVAACKQAWIGFGTTLGKVEYEVLLGTDENTKSCLRHVAKNDFVCYEKADLLSCTETRSFWITWYGGVFRVGLGEIIDTNQILEHDFADLRQLSYMGIATSDDVEGHWIFPESTENEFRIYNDGSSSATEVYNAYVNVPKTTGFVFELRSCQDAILALTSSPDSATGDFAYFLHVGSQANTQTQLYESASPTALQSVSTPNILSCDHARSFWVNWKNGVFSFGTGTVQGLYTHLSHPIPTINSVGLANKHESGAFWLVYKNAGDSMYLSLTSTDMYSSWLSVRQEVYKVFRVSTCDNVQLILADRKRNMADGLMKNAYEITITNSKTAIINKETGSTLNETSRSSVLSCGEYRSFWVSWIDAVISVGQGDVYGRNVLTTTWPATKPSPTAALSFATTSSTGAEMEFDSDRGDYMVPIVSSTAIDQKWMKLRTGVQWFYFKLGGGGGIVYLSRQHKSAGQGYQIYIGATSATLFRDQTSVASVTYATKPWQTEMLEFWVSWVGGKVEVGTGKHRTPASVFLSDPNTIAYDISSLAFATAEQQSKFRVLNEDGSEMTYDTVEWLNFSQLNVSVSHKTHTMFALQACHSAHILLSTIIHDDTYGYWIRLQDNERNGNSSIWAQMAASDSRYWSLKSDWRTNDILSCGEERFFWLSWKDGHIVIGQGQQVGRQVIIAFQAMSTYTVRALSISTQGTKGTWRFPLSNEDFQPSPTSTGLKSGEIAALVITCLALVALSAIFVFFLLHPPPIARSLLNVPSQTSGEKPVAFDNPLRTTSSRTPTDDTVPSYASPRL